MVIESMAYTDISLISRCSASTSSSSESSQNLQPVNGFKTYSTNGKQLRGLAALQPLASSAFLPV